MSLSLPYESVIKLETPDTNKNSVWLRASVVAQNELTVYSSLLHSDKLRYLSGADNNITKDTRFKNTLKYNSPIPSQ